ncbi:MAG: Na/Pi cotransporter family protein [Lachnospiraceae bacterium]|nr:Na/Pi cotransporter family protein [bacterium]MDY5518367.1 Na/Pi cotransporter family protein [Lachnospiraceae bacterium]
MSLILTLMGGLGLFLFGMNFMSQGLQKAAGAKLRSVLTAISKNKYIAVLFGALFTAIIQSSGATTVMVVTFVNAGLMELTQAVGIIFGANIGTTITAQLVSFNLTAIAPVILFVGVVMFLFLKKPIFKKIGEVVIGFGALFMGISMMSGAMSQLNDYPAVIGTLAKLTNPILAILVGLIITVIVQSSSVTVSILLLMAGQGLVTLPICFYFILGCNIGSCTPAVMAAMDAKKDAKRAALIHVLFNVFGMIIISVILIFAMEPFTAFIQTISGSDIKRSVANTDTIYKVFQTVIFLPFSTQFIKLVNRLVPGDDVKHEGFSLQYISMNTVFSPTAAIVEAMQEIARMGRKAEQNLQLSMEAFFDGDQAKIDQVYATEKYIDYLSHEITDYLVDVNQRQLPVSDSLKIGALFHVVNDIERIGDHAENIADAAVRMKQENIMFSKKATKEIHDMFEKDMHILVCALEMFENEDRSHMQEIRAIEEEVDQMEIDLQNSHIRRMAKGKCSPESGLIFTDLVSGLERVADHATNIAFALTNTDAE